MGFQETTKHVPVQFLSAVVFHSTEGVLVVDDAGRIMLCNPTAKHLCGRAQAELLGCELADILTLETAQTYKALAQDVVGLLHAKNGKMLPVRCTVSPIESDTAFLGSVVALTAVSESSRCQPEPSEVQASSGGLMVDEKLFRIMADAAAIPIWLLNERAELVYVNKAGLDYAGISFEDLQSAGFILYMHPDDREGTEEVLSQAFVNQSPFRYESRILRADGQYRWSVAAGGPIFDSDGTFLGLVGSTVDIHDLKEAKDALASYAQKLERSNKELEHFATIASHDLQEPLRKVILFSEHLKSKEQDVLSEEGLDDIERMQKAIQRMQRLISDLLDLSRVTRRGRAFTPTDLSAILREVLADLSYKIKEKQAQVEILGELPTLEADPMQLHQLFYQLLDNALTFLRSGVPPIVKIRALSNGAQCKIQIEDNGQGFKPEYAHKIFDIFVQLQRNSEYPGTGIGLTLARKIVERHGGTISAEGAPEKGAVFTISLPLKQTTRREDGRASGSA